tara:strand:- start:5907 stop:6143 length:237 start_codon:yes stop_codon:yes gene_type:complete
MKKIDLIDEAYASELYELIVTAEDAFDVHYTLKRVLEFFEEKGMKPPSRGYTPCMGYDDIGNKINNLNRHLDSFKWDE